MTKTFCDRCEAETTRVQAGHVMGIEDADEDGNGTVSIARDLCRFCYAGFLHWLGQPEAVNASDELASALESMIEQFGYAAVVNGQPAVMTGGLSALEDAFEALGWPDPYIWRNPIWCDAPVEPRCPNPTTSGTPTPDGYKRYCHQHFGLWQAAQKPPPSVDASDPPVAHPGNPSTRA